MLLRSFAITALFTLGSLLAADAPSFQVKDLAGKARSIATGKDVTVITFISTQCPISNDYNDRMSAVYRDYEAKGVKLFFLNANSTEPASIVAEHSKSAGFTFPVYKDETAAELLNAQVTPESYVFDKSGKLVYQGFIDDSRNPARVQTNGLRDALDAVLAGKSVAKSTTKAFGCSIKRARRS